MSITLDIPAIDHHSHASAYGTSSVGYRTVAEYEDHFATGHLESRVPSSIYQEFVHARNAHDQAALDRLDASHGVFALIREGRRLRSTTFFSRALRKGCALLYGTEDESMFESEGAALRAAGLSTPYDRALDVSGTAVALADVRSIDRDHWDSGRYRQVIRVDPYLYPFSVPERDDRGTEAERFGSIFSSVLEEQLAAQGLNGVPANLDDFVSFAIESLRRRRARGAIGYKFASAYVRSLRFERVARAYAAEQYAAIVSGRHGDHMAVTDYLATHIAMDAGEHGIPLQIHTGMGHPEPGMYISNANPLNLESFLIQPELNQTQIVLIHGAYPFTSEAGALAQTYGNVYLDFSWMPYLHHAHLRLKLVEWLEILPLNKLIFGTDTGLPEFHVAAVHYAREALDWALEDGLQRDVWTADQVDLLARRVLHDNAAELYAL